MRPTSLFLMVDQDVPVLCQPCALTSGLFWGYDFFMLKKQISATTAPGVMGVADAPDVPLISVVLPVHNGEEFIADAINSLLGQTLTSFEVLAVENGSTDNSSAILHQFARKDPRVHVITAGPVGLVRALNIGLKAARGRYIARMDADDVSQPQRFETQINYLERHPELVGVGAGHHYIGHRGHTIGMRRTITQPDAVAASFYFGNPIAHPTVMIDRQRAGDISYVADYPDAEDLELWVRLVRSGRALANVPDPLVGYRLHDASIMSRPETNDRPTTLDLLVRSSRWHERWCRWIFSRTFNARQRGIGFVPFVVATVALNAVNLVRPEVCRLALARRSLRAIAGRMGTRGGLKRGQAGKALV
jgi:glycosyltransferase involved in cell wall biosynthesis